jgi:Ni/Fe-hydrogenase b-type cytochrome subunit
MARDEENNGEEKNAEEKNGGENNGQQKNEEVKKDQPLLEETPAIRAADPLVTPLPSEAGSTPDAPPKSESAEPVPTLKAASATETAPAVTPIRIDPAPQRKPGLVRAAYEHSFAIRLTHWVNAVTLFVMVASGLRIFRAFPSFGPKIPEQDLIDIPKALTLGGWLGGALQWHFTFMWLFVGSGVFYLAYQVLSGHYRTVLFTRKDIPGVWPMVRHYFLFGPKPPVTEQYNPLQKLAYTSTVGFGALSVLTGIVLYKPAQFSGLAFLLGGFHLTRIWHFAAMCCFLAFIPGHLIMVALHGWSNFFSMLSGWKREPEYQE